MHDSKQYIKTLISTGQYIFKETEKDNRVLLEGSIKDWKEENSPVVMVEGTPKVSRDRLLSIMLAFGEAGERKSYVEAYRLLDKLDNEVTKRILAFQYPENERLPAHVKKYSEEIRKDWAMVYSKALKMFGNDELARHTADVVINNRYFPNKSNEKGDSVDVGSGP